MAKNMAVPPIRGATCQRPPILPMSRVWMRSCRPPTRMKRAPVERAWHTICRTTPCSASVFQAKMPEQHEAHVADARVGDQPLEVGLARRP